MEHLHPVTPHVIRELEGIRREFLRHDRQAAEAERILNRVLGVHESAKALVERYHGLTIDEVSIDDLLRDATSLLKEIRRAYTRSTVRRISALLGDRLTDQERSVLGNLSEYLSSANEFLRRARDAFRMYIKRPPSDEIQRMLYREGISLTGDMLGDTAAYLVTLASLLEDVYRKLETVHKTHVDMRAKLLDRYRRRLEAFFALHGLDVDLPMDRETLALLARTAAHRALPEILLYIRRSGERKLRSETLDRIYGALVGGAAGKIPRIRPDIVSLARLEGLPPSKRLDLFQKLTRIHPELLRAVADILEKDALEPEDVKWLLENKDRLAPAFLHIDPSVGRPFLDLMERLGTITEIRGRGLPRIDATNIEDAKKVLQHELLPVILKNWEIWASNVKTWAELYDALKRLRRTREYNTRGVIRREEQDAGTQEVFQRLQRLLRGARIQRRGGRTVVVGLNRSAASEAADLLRSAGVDAWVNRKGMLVVRGELPVSPPPPEKKTEKRVQPRRVQVEAGRWKEKEERGRKLSLISILKSLANAWRHGDVQIKPDRDGVRIVVQTKTHDSKVVLSDDFYSLVLGVLGVSGGRVRRLDDGVYLDRNAAQALLLAEDESFRNVILRALEKTKKKGGKR